VWKRQTLLPDIHRRGGIIENLLMTGKGGVSCKARGAGKVGYGNDTGAVAFSRTGDPATGDFSDATVLRKFGDVPDDLSAL
jgi:hypothetical protein